MNTVIILEGPDNIGKSTLVKSITNKFASRKWIVEHFGPNKTKTEGSRVFYNMIDTFKNCNKKNFILDRSPFGEFVYAPLYREYDPWTYWPAVKVTLSELKNTRFLFISLYADAFTYSQFGLKSKKDEKVKYQKSSQSEKISVAFIDVANKLSELSNMTRVVVNSNNYDTLNDRNKYILSRIKAFLKDEPYELPTIDNYSHTMFAVSNMQLDFENKTFMTDYEPCIDLRTCKIGKDHCKFASFGQEYKTQTVGCGNVTNPKYIFVGEAPDYLGCGTYGVPFYGDKYGYLFYDTLEKLNILSSEIYVTNTIKCCPKNNDLGQYYNSKDRERLRCVRNLPEELTAINGGEVIALGRVASTTLKNLGVPHKFIYHPAYYLRIGNNHKFVEELKTVIGR